MQYFKSDGVGYVQIVATAKYLCCLLSLQKHIKVNNSTLLEFKERIRNRFQWPLQRVQSSSRQIDGQCKIKFIFDSWVRRLRWWIQNELIIISSSIDNPQLSWRRAFGKRIIIDFDSANSGLFIVVHSNKERCLLEINEVAPTETAEV